MNLARGIPLIPFIFPINVYLIGGSIGAGFQLLLVRIVESFHGWSMIFLWRELEIVLNREITGRTAFSILFWVAGTALLALAAILIVSSHGDGRRNIKIYGLGCALLVISTIVQYGPLFHGPAGVAIPIGLPLLVIIGYLLWKDVARTGALDDDEVVETTGAASLSAPVAPNASTEDS